jgi:hypothetical protein
MVKVVRIVLLDFSITHLMIDANHALPEEGELVFADVSVDVRRGFGTFGRWGGEDGDG